MPLVRCYHHFLRYSSAVGPRVEGKLLSSVLVEETVSGLLIVTPDICMKRENMSMYFCVALTPEPANTTAHYFFEVFAF